MAATSSEGKTNSQNDGNRKPYNNNRRNNGGQDNRNRRNNRGGQNGRRGGPNGGRGGQPALKLMNPLRVQRIVAAAPQRRERQPRENNNERRPRQVATAETDSDGTTKVKRDPKSTGTGEFEEDDSPSQNRPRSGGRYATNQSWRGNFLILYRFKLFDFLCLEIVFFNSAYCR